MEESHDLFFLSRGAEGKENETSSLVGGGHSDLDLFFSMSGNGPLAS